MPMFMVPAKVSVRVSLLVEAKDSAEALDVVNRGTWDDDTWAARCEIVDTEATGLPRSSD